MWTSKGLLLDLETLILHHGIRKFTNLWHLWGSIFEVNMIICLSSLSEVFYKKSVLKNFGKLTRKHLCRSVFFKKVGNLHPAALFKRHSCTGGFKNTFFIYHFWVSASEHNVTFKELVSLPHKISKCKHCLNYAIFFSQNSILTFFEMYNYFLETLY